MSSVTVPVRTYRPDDLQALFQLDTVCFDEEFRFDLGSMRAFAGAQNAVTLVADGPSGEIIAFVIAQAEHHLGLLRGYVVTIDVAPAWRRMGLAGRLLEEAELTLAIAGVPRMELHVYTENTGAIRFYERMGYERTDIRRDFYGAPGLDAFVYQKVLLLAR